MASININNDEDRKSYEKVGLIYNAILNNVGEKKIFTESLIVPTKKDPKELFFERLLQKEGDINYKISVGSRRLPNLLHNALNKNYDFFALLLEYGADFTYKDEDDRTAIHIAIHKQFDDRMSMCEYYSNTKKYIDAVLNAHLKLNNPLNPSDKNGMTHFHAACITNNRSAIEFFLKNGVGVNHAVNAHSSIFSRYTPLHLAVKHACPDAVEILLKHGANIHSKNADGMSPLQLIPEKDIEHLDYEDDNENCERILDVFAKFMIDDDVSSIHQDESSVEGVVQQIVNINQRVESDPSVFKSEEEYGIAELHAASHRVDVELVKNLIKSGANVNAKVDSNSPRWQGYTPLHCATTRLFEEHHIKDNVDSLKKIIQLLTKHRADVLSVDNNNDTPFHFIKHLYHDSYRVGHRLSVVYPFLTILFDNLTNFNVNPVNNEGLSLFHVACITANVAIIKKFLRHDVDVNQAIGYFSEVCPGSTPVHLLIQHYRHLNSYSSIFGFSDKNFVRIVDLLLEKGANVNATDVFGNTPLHEAIVELTAELRTNLIQKFISHGANVHIENVRCDTSFKYLLRRGDATWEEIESFLKAGSNFNTHNPITQEGYMAVFLRFHRGIKSSRIIMENQIFQRIINNSKIIESNESGRTLIHNVVSIDPVSTETKKPLCYQSCPPFYKLCRRVVGLPTRKTIGPYDHINRGYDAEIIEQLLIQGCGIDHQDNEGKTALHLAVVFDNRRAMRELLKNGTDINVTDINGKTAFAYCGEFHRGVSNWFEREEKYGIDYECDYRHMALAMHVYKLEFCKQRVNEQNKKLKIEVLENLGPMTSKALDCFHDEMDKTKSMKIDNTSISLYDFLTGADTVYMYMTNEERRGVDQFLKTLGQHNFQEINCLLKLKYRQAVERIKLVEPAIESLKVLNKYQLPDLCCQRILKFLQNEDLKRLIASTA